MLARHDLGCTKRAACVGQGGADHGMVVACRDACGAGQAHNLSPGVQSQPTDATGAAAAAAAASSQNSQPT
jgi:hypothetical protein